MNLQIVGMRSNNIEHLPDALGPTRYFFGCALCGTSPLHMSASFYRREVRRLFQGPHPTPAPPPPIVALAVWIR